MVLSLQARTEETQVRRVQRSKRDSVVVVVVVRVVVTRVVVVRVVVPGLVVSLVVVPVEVEIAVVVVESVNGPGREGRRCGVVQGVAEVSKLGKWRENKCACYAHRFCKLVGRAGHCAL